MTKKALRKPKPWQMDTDNLNFGLDKIQCWKQGVMTLINPTFAICHVNSGQAFIISEQAIGWLDDDGNMDS